MKEQRKLEEEEWEFSIEPEDDGEADIPDEERYLKDWGEEKCDKFKKTRDDRMKNEDIDFAKTLTGQVTFEDFVSFEGSMEDIEPITIEMSQEKLDFIKRRKLEKTAKKKSDITEGI